MYKKIAELKVRKSADYDDKVAKALKKAGYLVVLEVETSTDKHYIISEKIKEE